MKKAFDQTVRDLKREVNKKVLKVPSIEQKVLDATSNEPWGPHGSHLADISHATRNYHEYQMIMAVIWKRINDTGKNWRHVYKALTVLEYLVAHGSERVIDEIREHAYQISTLSDFQYIDSNARDQGSNVRKKSQSLVALVNDKERIQEVRQKAAANRDKYRNTSGGGMYRPGSGGYGDRYDDDRYGSREEDRNGYGREREWGDDRYGRYGDSYSRDGDRNGSNYEERYSRDGYREDDSRGRSRSVDDYNYGPRSRSSDRDRDRAYDDDGQYSSRESGAKADDQFQDGSAAGRRLDRKYSEQNLGAPPSYEDAVGEGRSPIHSERDGETSEVFAPKLSSPPVSTSQQGTSSPSTPAAAAQPPATTAPTATSTPPAPQPQPPATSNNESDGFDEFDPRGSFPAAPTTTTSSGPEMDLLGSLSDLNSLAIVPATTTSEADAFNNPSSEQTFVATSSASSISNQPFEDPFGDGPFRAIPSADGIQAQPQIIASTSFTNQNAEQSLPIAQNTEAVNNFGYGDAFSSTTHAPQGLSHIQVPSTGSQYHHQELSSPNQSTDILAGILPPSGPSPHISSQTGFQAQNGQLGFPGQTGHPSSQTGFLAQAIPPASQTGFPAQPGQPSFHSTFPVQPGQLPSMTGFSGQAGQPALQPGFPTQIGHSASPVGFPPQMAPISQAGFPGSGGQPAQQNGNFYPGFQSQPLSTAPASHMSQIATTQAPQYNTSNFFQQFDTAGPATTQVRSSTLQASQPALSASTGALAIVPQPAKDQFETKSTVWADTLNRGLVNLNISGSKTNPLADIGIDFEAINRKEKRMEKPSAVPVTSNVTMGKAMGSGSGMGRASAGALRTPPNPMMGGGPGVGSGIGGYGGVNQPMGGMGMGMNVPMNMNMGVGMNMGQGIQMQPPAGFPPGAIRPGGYNPMMGSGGYGQHPYGSGYR